MADERLLILPAPVRRTHWLRRNPVDLATVVRLAVLTVFLAGWEFGYRTGRVDPLFFSSPSLIWSTLRELFSSGQIYPHISATIREAIAGLVLGFVAGSVVAWIAAQGRLIGRVIEPIMLLMNSVPRIVLAPIFIMWFGIGPNSKVAAAFFLVFVVIFFAVYGGLREVPEDLIKRVRMLGGGRRALLQHVYIPSVLTWVFSSLRITVGFAFTGAVVGEFIASTEGLGYLLNFAQNSFNASLMMATVTIIMVIIMLLFVVLQRVEDRMMRWKRTR